MATLRKTLENGTLPRTRLTGSANSTRSLTVRLPVDLFEHLSDLVHTGATDMTKALISVIRQHRDGTQGTLELSKIASGFSGLSANVADLNGQLSAIRDEISFVRGGQAKTLTELASTLKLLFDLLREGDPIAEDFTSSGVTGYEPEAHFLTGTADMPVARMPSSRPAQSPFGTENR